MGQMAGHNPAGLGKEEAYQTTPPAIPFCLSTPMLNGRHAYSYVFPARECSPFGVFTTVPGWGTLDHLIREEINKVTHWA